MKMLKDFIIFIAGLSTVVCTLVGIYYANKSMQNYDEGCYYLLIAIINYLTCIYLDKND